jgi:hypothetical protein
MTYVLTLKDSIFPAYYMHVFRTISKLTSIISVNSVSRLVFIIKTHYVFSWLWTEFLAYFPYFEKIKEGLWDHILVCLCIRLCLSIFLRIPPKFMLGGLWENLAVCLCILLNFLGLWGLWGHLALCVSVYSSPILFFIFYAVRVVLKESRRLVFPRTSCYILFR